MTHSPDLTSIPLCTYFFFLFFRIVLFIKHKNCLRYNQFAILTIFHLTLNVFSIHYLIYGFIAIMLYKYCNIRLQYCILNWCYRLSTNALFTAHLGLTTLNHTLCVYVPITMSIIIFLYFLIILKQHRYCHNWKEITSLCACIKLQWFIVLIDYNVFIMLFFIFIYIA